MKVKILGIDKNGNNVDRGQIILEGGKLITNPKGDGLLNEIINSPILLSDGKVTKDNPVKFIQGLNLNYKSAYLRASKAVE